MTKAASTKPQPSLPVRSLSLAPSIRVVASNSPVSGSVDTPPGFAAAASAARRRAQAISSTRGKPAGLGKHPLRQHWAGYPNNSDTTPLATARISVVGLRSRFW